MTKFNNEPMNNLERKLIEEESVSEAYHVMGALYMTMVDIGAISSGEVYSSQVRMQRSDTGESIAFEVTVREIEP